MHSRELAWANLPRWTRTKNPPVDGIQSAPGVRPTRVALASLGFVSAGCHDLHAQDPLELGGYPAGLRRPQLRRPAPMPSRQCSTELVPSRRNGATTNCFLLRSPRTACSPRAGRWLFDAAQVGGPEGPSLGAVRSIVPRFADGSAFPLPQRRAHPLCPVIAALPTSPISPQHRTPRSQRKRPRPTLTTVTDSAPSFGKGMMEPSSFRFRAVPEVPQPAGPTSS